MTKAKACRNALAIAITIILALSPTAQAAGAEVIQRHLVGTTTALKEGSPIAKLSVPRFGKGWTRVVYEGTDIARVLNRLGIGHFSGSNLPGQPGNFALAAHRYAAGGAFLNIDKLKRGDLAIVETAKKRFTYKFVASQVVQPSDIWVINPKPDGLTVRTSSNSLMTFTTCTPVHVNTHRYVVWFELVGETTL